MSDLGGELARFGQGLVDGIDVGRLVCWLVEAQSLVAERPVRRL